ncbi:Short transient receptor potential channel 1, partial [Armadillidium nasatum]
ILKKYLKENQRKSGTFNMNCVDPLGRSALAIAIENENMDMIELLLKEGIEPTDSLLYAINEEYVEAVEILLVHEEKIHKDGEPYSWQRLEGIRANYTSDITPLILAAHKDNYEILKQLLDRGAALPMPHDAKCGCDECVISNADDSLRSRVIHFAKELIENTRTSSELEIILNYDPDGPPFEKGQSMHLAKLREAVDSKQKEVSIYWLKRDFMIVSALLVIVSLHVETFLIKLFGTKEMLKKLSEEQKRERGALFSFVEFLIIIYVQGFIWAEIKALWKEGLTEFMQDLWNIIDFISNVLYVNWTLLRLTAWYQTLRESWVGLDPYQPRENWHPFDPMLIAEGMFGAANIFRYHLKNI